MGRVKSSLYTLKKRTLCSEERTDGDVDDDRFLFGKEDTFLDTFKIIY